MCRNTCSRIPTQQHVPAEKCRVFSDSCSLASSVLSTTPRGRSLSHEGPAISGRVRPRRVGAHMCMCVSRQAQQNGNSTKYRWCPAGPCAFVLDFAQPRNDENAHARQHVPQHHSRHKRVAQSVQLGLRIEGGQGQRERRFQLFGRARRGMRRRQGWANTGVERGREKGDERRGTEAQQEGSC